MNPRTTFTVALAWALLVVVVVHFADFPGSVPNFRSVSGGGTLLDASPAVTPDATYQRLTGYGEAGRRNYSFRNVTVDVLLPLSVLPFLFLLMLRAVKPLFRHRFIRAFLLFLPFAYVMFDLLENTAVLVLLAKYPDRMNLLASGLPYGTIIKRAASLLSLAVPLIMLSVQRARGTPNVAVATVE
jgi:hypothetical protein